jgi:hypothetical protein
MAAKPDRVSRQRRALTGPPTRNEEHHAMAAQSMSDQLREWVAKAIQDACLGEDFGYETAWTLTPPRLTYTVLITTASPLIGQGQILMPFNVPSSALNEETVRAGVHHVMGELRSTARKLIQGPAHRAPHN